MSAFSTPFHAAGLFLKRHPILREVLLWTLPALAVGAFWRFLLVSYLPYANWNADSRSYYSFAHNLTAHGYVSLYEKRRYLYPIFLLPVSCLPGSSLRWLALIQHALGWASLLPLGYLVRRSLVFWRFWIVPVTVFFASLPAMLWYERELLAETLFFDLLLWTAAGWVAWVSEANRERARRLFWWFFVPLALFMLTKPAGRFFWPGLLAGLLLVHFRQRVTRVQGGAIAALLLVSLTVGSKAQSAWLLYVSCFPLTELQTPLYAEYKQEIRPQVEDYRARLDSYYGDNGWAFEFLRDPSREAAARPAWGKLARDEKQMRVVYMALAKEAIRAHPWLYLQLGASRLLASANLSDFNTGRFAAAFYPRHFEHFYNEAKEGEKTPIRELFGLPRHEPLPPWAEFQRRLAPPEEPWAARTMVAWGRAVGPIGDLVQVSPGQKTPPMLPPRFTFQGWWLLAGAVLALTGRYRLTFGVWVVSIGIYLGAVFLFTIANTRYFALAWPILVPLAALPLDWLLVVLTSRREPVEIPSARGQSVPA